MSNILIKKNFSFLAVFILLLVNVFVVTKANAQVDPPDRRYLYRYDRNSDVNKIDKRRRLQQQKKELQAKRKRTEGFPLDIDAGSLNYNTSDNSIEADGGLSVIHSSSLIEAQKGKFDLDNNTAILEGNILVNDISGVLAADNAKLNLKTGYAELVNADVKFELGDYHVRAQKLSRSPGEVYEMEDVVFTTCKCQDEDSCPPWSLSAKKGKITREGYGQIWDSTLKFCDVPVFYLPYFVFPAKTKRQSGFLIPEVGVASRTGFSLRQPYFWAIDNSTDATLTAILDTNTRYGLDSEYRKVFSRNSKLQMGMIYLNESLRDGQLQGTVTSGLYDPIIDENRTAGYINQNYSSEFLGQPFQFLVDGRFTSDDLLLREYEKFEIGRRESRFLTSRVLARTTLFDTHSLSFGLEHSQALVSNDDFVFQRLPELKLTGFQNYKPFGMNPFGAKLVVKDNLSVTRFSRDKSFDGLRAEVAETFKVPFYVSNYLDADVGADFRATLYNLDETNVIQEATPDVVDSELSSSSNRFVPGMFANFSTTVEKVFDLDEDSIIKGLLDLGPIVRTHEATKIKHTVTPFTKFRFVPYVNQEDNPLFDSNDRLAQKNVVTYGVTQRFYSKHESLDPYVYGIEEIAPDFDSVGGLKSQGSIDPRYDYGVDLNTNYTQASNRDVIVREFANFSLSQSYDILEQRKDLDPTLDSISDLNAAFTVIPNYHFRLRADTNYDPQDQGFSSYGIQGQFIDKRGDELRTRLSYVSEQVRQLENSIEFKITDRVRIGYYSRYDDLASKFIQQRGGVRFSSSCNCWFLDFEVTDSVNPDQTRVSVNLTLFGLGQIGNTFFSSLNNNNNS